jgi:hypothetical protein
MIARQASLRDARRKINFRIAGRNGWRRDFTLKTWRRHTMRYCVGLDDSVIME